MLKISHSRQESETSLIVYFSADSSTATALLIADFAQQLRPKLTGIIELIPSASSLFIEFHILKTRPSKLQQQIETQLAHYRPSTQKPQLLELPVYYHPEVAPDLERLADQHKLSIAEVIERHHSATYTVTSLGFAPGFAYLDGLDPTLATPRLAEPKMVSQGSLGIADQQTAIYPATSPGGWSIIGNCPTPLFDITATPITPFVIGMQVRFTPISRQAFINQGGKL